MSDSPFVQLVLVIVIGYLFGSIPTAYIVAKAKGINIFEVGSKNMGATNVGRSLGFWWGILVWVCDSVKGIVAIAIATLVMPNNWAAATAIAATTAGYRSQLVGVRHTIDRNHSGRQRCGHLVWYDVCHCPASTAGCYFGAGCRHYRPYPLRLTRSLEYVCAGNCLDIRPHHPKDHADGVHILHHRCCHYDYLPLP